MKKILFIGLILTMLQNAHAQKLGTLPPFTDWYENPLGFHPLNLHTGNGIIIPAIAATACLLLTKKDTTLVNKISFYSNSGISHGYYLPKTTMYQNNTGFFIHLRKWLHIGAEFTVYHPRDGFNDTWGFGVRPMVRFLPIQKDSYRIFFESGAGLMYFLKEFPQPTSGYGEFSEPRTGTRWNGTPKYGVGAEVNVNQSLALNFGVQHVHVSNGNTWGKERNPGHDSNGFYIGFAYRPMQ
ncbi:MAG: acyloxyacyl hydrolase [Saprospiraceae bacterium]